MHYVISGIPVILATMAFGFMPWGLATAIATPIILALIAGLFPTKSYIQTNLRTALEGLSYGRLDRAKEHISIAIREAENAKSLALPEIESLRAACDTVATALHDAGQREEAHFLREISEKVTKKVKKNL